MADPFGNIPLNIGNAPTPAPSPTAAPAIPRPPISSVPTPAQTPAPVRAPIPAPSLRAEPENAIRTMPHHAGVGPIIGAAIIVVLFIFGGLYFWGAHLNAQDKAPLPLITQQ